MVILGSRPLGTIPELSALTKVSVMIGSLRSGGTPGVLWLLSYPPIGTFGFRPFSGIVIFGRARPLGLLGIVSSAFAKVIAFRELRRPLGTSSEAIGPMGYFGSLGV